MTSELETNIVAVERILEYTVTPTEASISLNTFYINIFIVLVNYMNKEF